MNRNYFYVINIVTISEELSVNDPGLIKWYQTRERHIPYYRRQIYSLVAVSLHALISYFKAPLV